MYTATRKIEIDAGHRIPQHDSKCKNLHGHRYVIEATIAGELLTEGSETGMVKDFGFMKRIMMEEIDAVFDHALILCIDDPIIVHVAPTGCSTAIRTKFEQDHYICYECTGVGDTKVILVKKPPTVENLAELWFHRLAAAFIPVNVRMGSLKAYETPNCWSVYLPGP